MHPTTRAREPGRRLQHGQGSPGPLGHLPRQRKGARGGRHELRRSPANESEKRRAVRPRHRCRSAAGTMALGKQAFAAVRLGDVGHWRSAAFDEATSSSSMTWPRCSRPEPAVRRQSRIRGRTVPVMAPPPARGSYRWPRSPLCRQRGTGCSPSRSGHHRRRSFHPGGPGLPQPQPSSPGLGVHRPTRLDRCCSPSSPAEAPEGR